MKIDFDQKLMNPSGAEPLMMDPPQNTEPATLAYVVSSALFSALPEDANIEPIKKAEIGVLGVRIYGGGSQEITPEEATLIRTRVAKVFPPLIVARVFEAIK